MITQETIGEILFDKCAEAFADVPIYLKGSEPIGEIDTERVVIITRRIESGKYWNRSMCEINYCVPNRANEKDGIRLKEAQVMMKPLHSGCGICENERYRFKKMSVGEEEDSDLRYHFVNLKVLFEILNV